MLTRCRYQRYGPTFSTASTIPSRWVVTCKSRASPTTTARSFKTSMSSVDNDEDRVRLRSEVEAPWRGVRLTLFGFGAASASMGLLVSIPQLIAALGGAANAMPVGDVFQNIGIDAGAAGLCGYFVVQDLKARDKQMARLLREERLAGCRLQLANGKVLALGALRGAARVVICAGTAAQVADALAAAEPYRAELARRGVLLVPAPIFEPEGGPQGGGLPPPSAEDLRWRAAPVDLGAWKQWFEQQLSLSSKATPERGLYVSLRKDGRVRASGMGQPPWAALAVQLPPEEGIWTGLLDGMDGRV